MLNKVMIPIRVCVLVGAFFALDRLCVEPWRCNRMLKRMKTNSIAAMSNPSPREASEIAQRNLSTLEAHAMGCRLEVDYYLMVAVNNLLLNRYEPAFEAYRNALAIDQRPEIYFDLGITLLESGRLSEATPHLIDAVRFNPTLLAQLSGEARRIVAARAGLE